MVENLICSLIVNDKARKEEQERRINLLLER
jgi:hypothetical protein